MNRPALGSQSSIAATGTRFPTTASIAASKSMPRSATTTLRKPESTAKTNTTTSATSVTTSTSTTIATIVRRGSVSSNNIGSTKPPATTAIATQAIKRNVSTTTATTKVPTKSPRPVSALPERVARKMQRAKSARKINNTSVNGTLFDDLRLARLRPHSALGNYQAKRANTSNSNCYNNRNDSFDDANNSSINTNTTSHRPSDGRPLEIESDDDDQIDDYQIKLMLQNCNNDDSYERTSNMSKSSDTDDDNHNSPTTRSQSSSSTPRRSISALSSFTSRANTKMRYMIEMLDEEARTTMETTTETTTTPLVIAGGGDGTSCTSPMNAFEDEDLISVQSYRSTTSITVTSRAGSRSGGVRSPNPLSSRNFFLTEQQGAPERPASAGVRNRSNNPPLASPQPKLERKGSTFIATATSPNRIFAPVKSIDTFDRLDATQPTRQPPAARISPARPASLTKKGNEDANFSSDNDSDNSSDSSSDESLFSAFNGDLTHFSKPISAKSKIEKKLHKLRTSPGQYKLFQERVKKIHEDRKTIQTKIPLEKNIRIQNKMQISSHMPTVKTAKMAEKFEEHNKKIDRVLEERKRIEEEYIEKAKMKLQKVETLVQMADIKYVKSQDLARRRKEWLSIVVAHMAVQRFAALQRFVIQRRLDDCRRENAAIVIQRAVRQFLANIHRTAKGIAIVRIQLFIKRWIRRRRQEKRCNAVKLIKQFLTDLRSAFFIMRAVKKTINCVLKVQRAYRSYKECENARIELLSLQWDKLVKKRTTALERRIRAKHNNSNVQPGKSGGGSKMVQKQFSGTSLFGGSTGNSSGNSHNRTSSNLINMSHHSVSLALQHQHSPSNSNNNSSSSHLFNLNPLEIDQEAYSLLVEREELLRIPTKLKTDILRRNYKERQRQYAELVQQYNKEMEEYNKKMTFERAHRLISRGDKRLFENLIKPVHPHLKVLLPDSAMNELIDEAWRINKARMQEQIRVSLANAEQQHATPAANTISNDNDNYNAATTTTTTTTATRQHNTEHLNSNNTTTGHLSSTFTSTAMVSTTTTANSRSTSRSSSRLSTHTIPTRSNSTTPSARSGGGRVSDGPVKFIPPPLKLPPK